MNFYQIIQLVVSKAERGLWYDHDEREYDPKGWGAIFKLYLGHVYRPIPKPQFWFKKGVPDSWNEFDPQFHWMIHFWFPLLPFFSICIGEAGIYAGFKTFSLENERYRKWGVGPEGYALTPSVSTRWTRWK